MAGQKKARDMPSQTVKRLQLLAHSPARKTYIDRVCALEEYLREGRDEMRIYM
jgi:hypothetical protein